MRYISRVDRYFGAQSEYYWTLVAAGLVMCTTILMFFCLYKFSGDDDEATLNAAEAAAAASIKTIKMRSTMSEANHLIDQTTIPSIAHAAKQRKK